MRFTSPAVRLLLLPLVVTAGFSLCALAQNQDIDFVLSRLGSKAAGIETISSSFTQEKRLCVFNETVVSSGRFLFSKPDRLRWEYSAPMAEGFALLGDTGLRWTEMSPTPARFSLRDDPFMNVIARQLLAWATFDLRWLSGEYDISLAGSSPVTLKLTPKRRDVATVLDHLLIEFSPAEDTVRRVEIHDRDGDFTRIIFENATVNAPLADDLFR
jgi:outer membrane lipoprotein-sorting protein